MPIKTQGDLPVKEILERENIFVMDEKRAMHQDIRPIQILILNLMPLKEETELQLLRSLSNTPLQVDVTFMAVESHEAKNTSLSHLNKFYETFSDVKKRKFDGMIITGAPVEQMPFEEVDYWEELTKILNWTEKHVTSTIFLCWAAQAGLYHFYGLEKKPGIKFLIARFRWCVVLMMYFLLLIPDIPKFRSPIFMPAKTSLFWRKAMRQACFLQWQKAAVRFSSWAIRNTIA